MIFLLRFLIGLALLVTLNCCGSSSPAPIQDDPVVSREVEDFFLHFRLKVQAEQADSLPAYLSRESLNWLDDIRRAARTEAQEYLQARPFFEILSILALRLERRQNPSFDDRPRSLLEKLVIQAYPVRKALIKTDLGPAKVFGEHAEMGLREAPNIPVFHFVKESRQWKFNIMKSLPLILQGAESLGRQRKPTHLLQAIYILEQFGGKVVLPEDLRR